MGFAMRGSVLASGLVLDVGLRGAALPSSVSPPTAYLEPLSSLEKRQPIIQSPSRPCGELWHYSAGTIRLIVDQMPYYYPCLTKVGFYI